MGQPRHVSRVIVALGCAALLLFGTPVVAIAGLANAMIGTSKVQNSPVLADHRGHTLYLWTGDRGGRSGCYGDCLHDWKPLLTAGKVFARNGSGVNQKLLGTTRRRDGKLQVTYNRHPLYTYNSDNGPGQDYGQGCAGFSSGHWWMLNRSGNAVKGIVGVCQGY
jgi:predicted lipoprotein with Yx(FWY)xxD motif